MLVYAYQQYLLRVQESRSEIGRRSTRTPPSSSSLLETLSQQTDLSLGVLNHLSRVYATLGLTVLVATAGSVANANRRLSSQASSLISLGFALALLNGAKTWKLMGFGFFSGASLSSLLRIAQIIDPSIVPVALASSTAIFSSFAVGALFTLPRHGIYRRARRRRRTHALCGIASTLTTRRSLLFLYGGLNSLLSVLTVSSLANLYFKSAMINSFQLYAGLAMFTGYVAADSQLIIERADLEGNRDYVTDAMMLFTDVMAIFVRLVVLLAQRQSAEAEEERRRQKRDRSHDRRGGGGVDYDDS